MRVVRIPLSPPEQKSLIDEKKSSRSGGFFFARFTMESACTMQAWSIPAGLRNMLLAYSRMIASLACRCAR